MKGSSDKAISYCLLTIPGVLIYVALVICPIIFSFGLGFTDWKGFGPPRWNDFANYIKLFSDPIFWFGFRNNLLIMLVSVLGQIPVGFFLAYCLYRGNIKFSAFFESMIFLPVAISSVVVAILWKKIFSAEGLFTWILRFFSGNKDLSFRIFENPDMAMMPILFIMFWMYTGIFMVMYLANLQKVNPSIIEAAIIDGASESRMLFAIIIPLMRGAIFTTLIFAIAGSFKSFDLVYVMTGGGPAHMTEVIAIHMYNHTFINFNFGYGSAVSTVIVLLSVLFIGIAKGSFRFFERNVG